MHSPQLLQLPPPLLLLLLGLAAAGPARPPLAPPCATRLQPVSRTQCTVQYDQASSCCTMF